MFQAAPATRVRIEVLRESETTIKIKFALFRGGGQGGGLSGPISRDTAVLSLPIPHIARYLLREFSIPPKWCDTPPWYLILHRHICAIPHFATYRAIIVRYPIKTSTKDFCDTIAASIARYEKYRCWASRGGGAERKIVQNAIFHGNRHDNKSLKVNILLSRNYVVMAQAPKNMRQSY